MKNHFISARCYKKVSLEKMAHVQLEDEEDDDALVDIYGDASDHHNATASSYGMDSAPHVTTTTTTLSQTNGASTKQPLTTFSVSFSFNVAYQILFR